MSRRTAAFALVLVAAGLACSQLNRPEPRSTSLETGGAPTVAAPSSSLRVVTYNVHMARAKALTRTIENDPVLRTADVILLQEIEAHPGGPSESARVARALGLHHAYAPGYGLRSGGSHGVAVLSRHRLVDVEIIELPRRWTVVNSARRVALGVTVLAAEPVRVWNVHLDNRINPRDRSEQLAPVLAAAGRSTVRRQIIGGDLNTSPYCWVARLVPVPCGLQTRKIERAFHRSGFVVATRGSGATSRYFGMRLDAIAVRGLQPRATLVLDHKLSDHLPLWTELDL